MATAKWTTDNGKNATPASRGSVPRKCRPVTDEQRDADEKRRDRDAVTPTVARPRDAR
jgi:hypothetical protein